jgi:hypothetical protein
MKDGLKELLNKTEEKVKEINAVLTDPKMPVGRIVELKEELRYYEKVEFYLRELADLRENYERLLNERDEED